MSRYSLALVALCALAQACHGFVVRSAPSRHFALYGGIFVEPKEPKTKKRYCTTRAGKTETIKRLAAMLTRTKAILRYTYKRFTPNERLVLNKRLKAYIRPASEGAEPAAKLQMVKNTLIRKAMADTAWEVYAPRMHGPSLCCFVFDEEKLPQIVASVERLRAAEKKIRRHVTIDSASFAGRVVEPPELFQLATFASRDHLIARLMCALNGSGTRVASGLNSLATKLAVALNETTKPRGEGEVAVDSGAVTAEPQAAATSTTP